jgi:hypothetical protein
MRESASPVHPLLPCGHRHAATTPEDAAKLGESPQEVREEHEAKTAEDTVEPRIGKHQVLCIHLAYFGVGDAPLADVSGGELDHGRRHVNADDMPL